MIKILLIFIIPLILNASQILSYNIYDRTERADVMLTFDTPYNGVIKQSISKSKIIIKLEDAEIESPKLKDISSKFLYSINIIPMSGYTQIIASVPQGTILKASKTADAYGLRLRFTDKITTTTKADINPLSNLPTKEDKGITQSYYIVISILIIGIIILFYIRRKITPKKEQAKQKSWLFKENQQEKEKIQESSVSIRFQKQLDTNNSVVMLDFAQQSYLILMGHNNILLDKFTDNKPATEEDFETLLKDRHQELDNFLKVESNQLSEEPKEALQAYKEKAASIYTSH
ncbi:MAG: hypothetical protein U9N33_04765 [Campylobacterota bacterium]|nr:hypothetical protein [Campylobacterota bacterium]